jgi:hypothetical protein
VTAAGLRMEVQKIKFPLLALHNLASFSID